ncbi:tetratricopeptide repeat protein [Granulicella rosea]|uniref:tetratricopeptide repeat protein n=1 Tax=Granulicella rosea TaxID=474952 RepID=UPI001FE8545A|nr:tetratricopeptide repeat protein [Granulicella rosea]
MRRTSDVLWRIPTMQRWCSFSAAFLSLAIAAGAQPAPQSSSSSPAGQQAQESTSGRPHSSSLEAGGAAITLETSEAMFNIAVALNACGYDNDLANSSPIRAEVRAEVDAATASAPEVKASRAALCRYIHEHELSDKGRDIAQYISLGLYITPDLKPTADETEMPPDALNVVNLLPLLRTFSEQVGLKAIWQKHRPEYEAITNGMHDQVTRMILDTNVYLRLPVSSYDGRRFLVLMEPMLAPREPNGRIYATDYIIVSSPSAGGAIRMDQIRHIYLQYAVEPLVYARAQAMNRLLPLLKPAQQAPLEFAYKSDITLLLTECLIKAIEAHTMDVGIVKPAKPTGMRDRQEFIRYDAQVAVYDRNAEEIRRSQVDQEMRHGWVLVDYFYDELAKMERDSIGLKEYIGEMVYGMDVLREQKHESEIVFLPPTSGPSGDFVKRSPRVPTGMMLAEKMMLEGDIDGARDIAKKALDDPKQDHAEANYVMARVQLMEGEPQDAVGTFADVINTSKNPHTIAWSYVYLGRLYDTLPDRGKATQEYKEALKVQGLTPDAKYAAEEGLKKPFTLPKSSRQPAEDKEEPLDPSGKAEKDSYKPDAPN